MAQSLFSILSDIEDQSVQLDRARVVLGEAVDYVDTVIEPDSWEARYFCTFDRHTVMTLLHITDELLHRMDLKLSEVAKALNEAHEEKGSCNG